MAYQQEPPQIGFKNTKTSRPLGFGDNTESSGTGRIGFKSSENPKPVETVSVESLYTEFGHPQSPIVKGRKKDRDIASASGVHTKVDNVGFTSILYWYRCYRSIFVH